MTVFIQELEPTIGKQNFIKLNFLTKKETINSIKIKLTELKTSFYISIQNRWLISRKHTQKKTLKTSKKPRVY